LNIHNYTLLGIIRTRFSGYDAIGELGEEQGVSTRKTKKLLNYEPNTLKNTQNNAESQAKHECSQRQARSFGFSHLNFEFVSYFDIRISYFLPTG
jgi:hypothetical protein